ncbi:ABC transporter substrate-binding protein [Veillonella caviae]|uniref:ABC transporter substrate-binding protein n=1 Tax=Veillonella caviae TaxID=248316 RepID=UPI0023F777EA|nr:extracellular solute-binding protein [Veillonella caviae]
MKRWMAFSVLSLFIIAMLSYGIFYYHEEQVERAKVPIKGEITVYTDLPNNLTTLLADKYLEERNVKVTILPLTEEQMTQRVSSSLADTSGDIVLTSEDNLVMGAQKDKFLPVVNERIDEVLDTLKDVNGYWVGLWYDPVVFVQHDSFYNEMGRYITTWNSLQKPGDWRVVMTDFVASQNAANLLYNMVEYKGEPEALSYLLALKPHIMQHAKFLSTPIRLTALGESDIGIGNLSDAQQYVRHSYPVKIIYPGDGTSYYVTGAAVQKNSKHKNESIEFITWLLSADTAKYMKDNNFTYIFTNPEVVEPLDSLGRSLVLWPINGGYTLEGKQLLLNHWVSQVRFRREP